MNSIYDLRKFLQNYGVFIYTGDREGDLDLFEMELKQLYEWNMIDALTLQKGLIILKKELTNHKRADKSSLTKCE
ncbi:hypothetical protein BKP45_09340 [Anaerobacillus alkalidiazotrophicus]|uniref:Cytosolic protein n=1 Tax=Anaerobacillus alkalidiazotrophicus TaxID=472963 RepID=A0A1S2M667_9BACI|nr:YqgQ family protein [Anaerobacillus alkalidiazotrophicus]OIJ20262.1 hypothetical protein BKP45_09340 [Anaerobacillus alkalidiazotrophicus]